MCKFPECSTGEGKCKLWRLSFSEAEKELILFADGKLHRRSATDKTYRKVILRLLKDDLSQLKPVIGKALCSYHMKTIFLHCLDQVPSERCWTDQESNIRRRYVGALRLLVDHLKCRNIPHYFIGNVNLIDKTLLSGTTWNYVEKYFSDRAKEYEWRPNWAWI